MTLQTNPVLKITVIRDWGRSSILLWSWAYNNVLSTNIAPAEVKLRPVVIGVCHHDLIKHFTASFHYNV